MCPKALDKQNPEGQMGALGVAVLFTSWRRSLLGALIRTPALDVCQRAEVRTHGCDRNNILDSSRALLTAHTDLAPELTEIVIVHTSLWS